MANLRHPQEGISQNGQATPPMFFSSNDSLRQAVRSVGVQ